MSTVPGLGEQRLKYLVVDTDRHGNVRLYVRRKEKGKVRLRARPGTRAFLDEYWAAFHIRVPTQDATIPPVGHPGSRGGTFPLFGRN